RVLPSAALAPGWPPNLVVSDPSQPYVYDISMAADGSGGMHVAWQVYDGGADAGYVQHLLGSGNVSPGFPPYGTRLASTCGQFNPLVVSDASGGAIVVWLEVGGVCERGGLWAQHYPSGSATAVLVSLVSASARPDR